MPSFEKPETRTLETKNQDLTKEEQPEGMEAEKPENIEASGEPQEEKGEARTEKMAAETLIKNINEIDKRLWQVKRSIVADKIKINALQAEMGSQSRENISEDMEFDDEIIKNLEGQRKSLIEEKNKWVSEHVEENLPAGIAIPDEEGGRLAVEEIEEEEKGELNKEDLEKLKEYRREWLDQFKEQMVKDYEEAIRDDWNTCDAINLENCVQIMKTRVPAVLEGKLKDFLEGKTDDIPKTMNMRWKCTSFIEELVFAKPHMIKSLDFEFDDNEEEVVSEAELMTEPNKEQQEENSKDNPMSGQAQQVSQAEHQPEQAQ